MSRDQKARSSLFGALFFPALILGVLIIVAFFVISFNGKQQRAIPDAQGDSDTRQLSDDTIAKFKQQYDALGMAIGSPNAPVTIREFGDYQCPACARFESTADRIRHQLVASGRVRFIFFDFPLQMHEHSHQAAIAARCAARQHGFWPYHSLLYKNQDKWADLDDPRSTFLDLAVESGLSSQRLQQCIDQKATAAVIAKEKDAGKAVKLRATPTVIVGHTLFSGIPDYARIKQIVDHLAPPANSSPDNAQNQP